MAFPRPLRAKNGQAVVDSLQRSLDAMNDLRQALREARTALEKDGTFSINGQFVQDLIGSTNILSSSIISDLNRWEGYTDARRRAEKEKS